MKLFNCLLSVLAFGSSLVQGQFEEETNGDFYSVHPHSLHAPFVDKLEMTWFDFGGDTVIDTYSHVRLTPDSPSRTGYIWSKMKMPVKNWQVEFEFKIGGSSSHISGDGFAFWITNTKGKEGPVFGNEDSFKGLGLFFDTYANAVHDETFPYVSAMISDGNARFDGNNDGFATKLGGCSADLKFRSVPTRALVTYVKGGFLEVKLQTNSEGEFQHCFTIVDPKLPEEAYMGFTALTGQLHDFHDIVSVTTRTSHSTPKYVPSNKSAIKKSGGSAVWTVIGWLFKLGLVGALVALVYYGYTTNKTKANKRF